MMTVVHGALRSEVKLGFVKLPKGKVFLAFNKCYELQSQTHSMPLFQSQ